MDERVKAIREDKAVGSGSCTSIDECFGDKELAEMLDKDGIKDTSGAVRWAREYEGLWVDKALDCRWGDDDDPQLKMKEEWEQSLKDNPID